MPFPSRTNRQSVIHAALHLIERGEEKDLTIRSVALEVGVTANAIYRYFESRDDLAAAAADAAAHRLYDFVEKGLLKLHASEVIEKRIRKLLALYVEFADVNPTLWHLIINARREDSAKLPEPHYHKLLWDRSLSIITPLVRPKNAKAATLSLWGQMHGLWSLHRAGAIDANELKLCYDFAFDAIINGMKRR